MPKFPTYLQIIIELHHRIKIYYKTSFVLNITNNTVEITFTFNRICKISVLNAIQVHRFNGYFSTFFRGFFKLPFLLNLCLSFISYKLRNPILHSLLYPFVYHSMNYIINLWYFNFYFFNIYKLF